MKTLTFASALVLTPMAGVALWNLLGARRLERSGPPRRKRTVSLLVPARDEEENLRRTLPAMLRLDHPALEILVVDDGSSDGTADVVNELVREHAGRLRLIAGAPLPVGWLGKNWACHQLAHAAEGEVLIFCDADVIPRNDAVRLTLGALEGAAADVLTALPRHRFDGWGAAAVVPLIAQLPLSALLPLPLVACTSTAALSMGNGQWLAFTRGAYRGCGGHAAVRSRVVEDVALARRVKAAGYRLEVAIATGALEVRMYGALREVREGFAKNLYALGGGRPTTFAVAAAGFMLAAVAPWAAALVNPGAALRPLALLALVRACAALQFRHPLRSLLLHPVGSLLVLRVAFESVRGARHGVLWKGRPVGGRVAGSGTAGRGAASLIGGEG